MGKDFWNDQDRSFFYSFILMFAHRKLFVSKLLYFLVLACLSGQSGTVRANCCVVLFNMIMI